MLEELSWQEDRAPLKCDLVAFSCCTLCACMHTEASADSVVRCYPNRFPAAAGCFTCALFYCLYVSLWMACGGPCLAHVVSSAVLFAWGGHAADVGGIACDELDAVFFLPIAVAMLLLW